MGIPVFSILTICAIGVMVLRYWQHGCNENVDANWSKECKVQGAQGEKQDSRKGKFKLADMNYWHEWLSCEQITRDVVVGELIDQGAVKKVHIGKWNNYNVAVSVLQTTDYYKDFMNGLEMLQSLGPHERLVQLVGFCTNPPVMVTEYHSLGSAANAISVFKSLDARFQLCVDYVEILSYLHNSPSGTRVMCDTNSVEKTLQQFLVTDDMRLIVNDLDALPVVTETKVKCGHRRLTGDFVAPEQLWPYEHKEFSESEMPGYDEKTDIWKIPEVCHSIVRGADSSDVLMFYLFKMHARCKLVDRKSRPTADEVLKFYLQVQAEFFQYKEFDL